MADGDWVGHASGARSESKAWLMPDRKTSSFRAKCVVS